MFTLSFLRNFTHTSRGLRLTKFEIPSYYTCIRSLFLDCYTTLFCAISNHTVLLILWCQNRIHRCKALVISKLTIWYNFMWVRRAFGYAHLTVVPNFQQPLVHRRKLVLCRPCVPSDTYIDLCSVNHLFTLSRRFVFVDHVFALSRWFVFVNHMFPLLHRLVSCWSFACSIT